MVCTYKCTGSDGATLVPRPIFGDSFYVAGDDILRNIIQNVIIEDRGDDYPDMGKRLRRPQRSLRHHDHRRNRSHTLHEQGPLLHSRGEQPPFGIHARGREPHQGETRVVAPARLLRRRLQHDGLRRPQLPWDFNTQISHPMAQSSSWSSCACAAPSASIPSDEIFSDMKPSQYLLDYFADHFGFRFEELKWRFDRAAWATL